ncbi:calponin homology domain-containing protein [Cokeromyces recurvatus]|uniref:calponin homology domain-containing protein n=1 Tax=Cokeromyces recurvatus TaxID=90255 RepID=UPI0022200B3A|nr:calponin homology domain-containing protein [Cokeromyces recurvatus]KAI7903198.1 calponin homology domain-containing protein [Cokeromyces recurvatus]
MVNAWTLIQKKTFTKWVNNKLDLKSIPNVTHLNEDLANGVRLIQLLEIISGESLRPYNQNPNMIFQKMENVNKALDFIKQRGVSLTNIGAEDIVNKNLKLVLGMLWTIILRFTIADINQDGKNAKEGLLLWCQRKTANYEDVDIRDFTYSWTDGLAFCALIHHHHPELIDYHSLDKNDRHGNTAIAFEAAKKLNIPQLLDVEDVCDISKPDEKSVMTYVAEYFHAFSAHDEFETAGRRVAKFADVLASVWEMEHQYEQRVCALMKAVTFIQKEWENTELSDSYMDAKEKSTAFDIYKSTEKRAWVAEKRDIDALLGNIQTKAKTYNLKPYYPPAGLTLKDLDNTWNTLLQNEAKYHRRINRTIREIKEGLRKAFADAANDFQHQLDSISAKLVELEGSLQSQLDIVQGLTDLFEPLQESLEMIEILDGECKEAHTEENDYTVYSLEDLTFGLDLVKEAVQKKSAFIQNQIVSRNMTNLTPLQLEEFEQTFRYFDKDYTNTLSVYEFKYALSSLGIIYDNEKLESIFYDTTNGVDYMSFEQFIRFMVSVTEDKTTPGQLLESFKTMSGDKPFITELDLRMSQIPMHMIDYLKTAMPRSSINQTEGYDYEVFVEEMFN